MSKIVPRKCLKTKTVWNLAYILFKHDQFYTSIHYKVIPFCTCVCLFARLSWARITWGGNFVNPVFNNIWQKILGRSFFFGRFGVWLIKETDREGNPWNKYIVVLLTNLSFNKIYIFSSGLFFCFLAVCKCGFFLSFINFTLSVA